MAATFQSTFTVTAVLVAILKGPKAASARSPVEGYENVLVQPLRQVASDLPTIHGLGSDLGGGNVDSNFPRPAAADGQIWLWLSPSVDLGLIPARRGPRRFRERPFWTVGITVHRFTGPIVQPAATRCMCMVGRILQRVESVNPWSGACGAPQTNKVPHLRDRVRLQWERAQQSLTDRRRVGTLA